MYCLKLSLFVTVSGQTYIERNCRFENNTQIWSLVNFYFDTGNTAESGALYKQGWLPEWTASGANPCDYCSWEGVTCAGDKSVIGLNVCKFALALKDTTIRPIDPF